ncbi:hypothetical protein EST38_g8352 [Candolleomyces aberdarensis]|uniref:Uncharacterized protein n=1 Tax=Candolleomyces aberdarensis TaxID=2316362 RepID=A0A4Q2DDG1_9AGAR|nr:hypothetical protein EST38_g8352 [Candolleomyces aberdarensis]
MLETLTIGKDAVAVSDIFNGGAPRLQRLFLVSFYSPMCMSALRGETISELALEVERLDWNRFHDGLHGLKKTLKTLSVNAFFILVHRNPPCPVEFTQLNTLSLRGYDPDIFRVLDSIRIPLTTRVEVAIWDNPRPVPLQRFGFDYAFKAISTCRSVDLEPRSLVLSRGEPYLDSRVATLFRLRAWVNQPSSCPPHGLVPSETCLISVASIADDRWDKLYDHPGPPFSISAGWSLPLPGMSLAHLESMCLQHTQGTGDIPLANDFWDDLSRLPNLSALSVRTYDVSSLLKQLNADSLFIEKTIGLQAEASMPSQSSSPENPDSASNQQPQYRRRFQSLKSLCFDGRDFDPSYSWCDFTSESFFETVRKNSRLRHRLGSDSTLRAMSFLEWECVPEGWSEEFSQFVSDIESYGVTLRFEPEGQ